MVDGEQRESSLSSPSMVAGNSSAVFDAATTARHLLSLENTRAIVLSMVSAVRGSAVADCGFRKNVES
jgi:hypothetical protein